MTTGGAYEPGANRRLNHTPDCHWPADHAGACPEPEQAHVRDVLLDCLSSFHGSDGYHTEEAVDFLLSPASGLRIEVDE